MPITRFKDEKEKKEYLKQLEEQRKSNLEIEERTRKEANQKFNDLVSKESSQNIDRLPTARLSNNTVENYTINSPLNILTAGALGSKINPQKDKIFNKPKEFEDNYVDNSNIFTRGALGKVGKSILGTATDATQDLGKGMLRPIENVLDIGTNLIATGLSTGSGALGIKNEELANGMRDFANKDLLDNFTSRVANVTPFGIAYNIADGTPEKIFNPAGIKYDTNKNLWENYKDGFKKAWLTDEEENYEKSSVLGEKADQAVEMIGYSFGNKIFGDTLSAKTGVKEIGGNKLGASISGGNVGIKIGKHTLNLPTLSFAGGMAGGLQEANSKENISEAERWAKGISGGIIETGSEGLFGFLGIGGNDITDDIKIKLANKFSTKVGKMLAQLGVECTGEAIEEFVSYAGNFLVDNGIVDKLGNADFSSEWDWNEVLEEMAMAFVTTGISGSGNIVITNNASIKTVEQQIGRKLTDKEKAGVTQAVIDGTLYEKTQVKNNEASQNTIPNLQQNETNSQLNSQEQQIIPQNIKMPQNQNIEQIDDTLPVANEENRYTKSQLDEMLNNKDLPMQGYQYVKSDNVKVDNFRKEASMYFNNSEKARNYIDMLEKIIIDKDIEIRLDGNLKTSDGKIANGSYSNGVITINPNSTRAGEFIAIHELTHAIGTKSMIDMVENYRKSNTEFDLAVEQLLQNYNTSEINEEALADVSAQLFGNQEFINNIAQENPSIFKKIYSEIKYLWHQFRGYKNQQQFIDDLYYKWTQAYNSNNKLNTHNSYAIETNDKGYKYVRADRQVISGNNPEVWKEQAKNYIDEKIRNNKDVKVYAQDGTELTITKNTSGKATFRNEVRQADGTIRKLTDEEFASKLRAETHIDELGQISTHKNGPVVDTKNHDFAKDGFTYRNAYFEDIDGQYYKITMSVGKNGDINTIYNVGKMQQAQKNRSNSTNRGFKDPNGNNTASSRISSINSITNSNEDVNTTTKYSMQESESNSGSLQQYLDKNFKSEGTKTNLQDIKLPTAHKNTAPSAKNNVAETSNIKNSWSTKQEEVKNEEKVAKILEQPIEKVKEKDRTWAIMKANLVDKGIVFEELSHKTKNRELQGKWDYTLTASARGQNAIGQARYEMDAKSKTEKQICKGLEDIRSEVGNKTNDFQNYMYHQLNIDRMTLEDRFGGDTGLNYERKGAIKNKPVFSESVTAEISQKIVNQYEQKNPEFKKWAQDIYDFNNANKQELVKNGVISQELADTLGELYPHYVPIKRVNTNGSAIKVPLDTNRTGVNSPLARAKGGNSDIQPLFQTLAERTMQTYSASARNSFGVELMNTLNSVQEKQQTDIDTILENIGNIEQNAELLQEGKNGSAPTFTVFNNGEKVTFEITKDMYDALKPLSDSSILSKTFKLPNKISNFRRGVLTEYNPLFLITNAVKDSQDVLINSQHALKTYSKFPEAYQQIISKGYWYNEYVRNGGEQNSYFKDGKFESDIKVNKAKSALQVPLNAISKINNVIEMAPRLAEYIASREKGVSIETSMLDSSRVTTNFKAGGDITKFANRNGATFLNASVQGASQQIRNIVEANTKGLKGYAVLATKYAIAGLPALILNGLIWKDDEDYEELQDYVKDNYYIIGKYGDGKFIRIPKGRTTAVIQKLVNNVSEYVNKDKELNIDNFAKDFWTDIQFGFDNLEPNNPLDNNVISPIIQVITNKSWYGEDIVPSRLQDKPKAEQYDESTDSLSIWLGEKLKVSPYKINYLLDQYGGGISDVALPMMTKQAENNPIEDKFTTDSVMKNKYPGEFYSKLDELKVKNNSDKAADEDKLKYKYFSSKSADMSDLYKKKREIQNSDLSDEEKKKQLKVVQSEINNIAKSSLQEVDNLNVSGSSGKVGDSEFYNDGEKWNTLKDGEAAKNKDISLNTYSDYKTKVQAETKRQRKAGDISENGKLKDKDKIKILINSNYSNKEKTELYENYVSDSDDEKFPIVKEIFNLKKDGLNINDYLEYKSQEFKADRKDDGTVEGKVIRGSRQDKIFNYIDSIDYASYSQKLILYALENKPASKSDRDIVVNFVDNLPNKTPKERLEIMKQFSGVKFYKDGTFDY